MRVEHPPGRAGRPWLVHRLQIARRGAALLDEKHRALTRERNRLRPLVDAARERWELAAREADRLLAIAEALGGRRQVEVLRAAASPPADVRVSWRTVLGVRCPVEARVLTCPEPERSALIGAARAHRAALRVAVELAGLECALRRIERELRLTAVRRNAIERRWIPAHERALAELELMLEELEREDGARVRRLTGGRPGPPVRSVGRPAAVLREPTEGGRGYGPDADARRSGEDRRI